MVALLAFISLVAELIGCRTGCLAFKSLVVANSYKLMVPYARLPLIVYNTPIWKSDNMTISFEWRTSTARNRVRERQTFASVGRSQDRRIIMHLDTVAARNMS